MSVYLLRAGESGPVKIGMSSGITDARARISSLQTAHWEVLRLLRLWRGEAQEERLLHAKFADLRIQGEWFSFSRLMVADVGLEVMYASEQDVDGPVRAVEIIRRIGGPGEAARLCRTSPAMVSRWIEANLIPEDHWPLIVGRAAEMGREGVTSEILAKMTPDGELRQGKRSRRVPLDLGRIPSDPIERENTWLLLRSRGVMLEDIARASGVTRQRVHQVLARSAARGNA